MNIKILVTYASQGGSTAGIAEAIAQALKESGAVVDVRPVQTIDDLGPYQAVIIGSAVHSGKWMPEALDFVTRNQNALRRIPTAIFQVCMMAAAANEQYRQMPPEWLSAIRMQFRPAAEASFAGALWPDRYAKLSEKLGLRIFLAAIKLKAGDYRDWTAVCSWAKSLQPLLAR